MESTSTEKESHHNTCVNCEWLYLRSSTTGVCHKINKVVNRDSESCKKFKERSRNIVDMFDEIARILSEGDKAVILEDGSPLYTIGGDMLPDMIEILLRCLHKGRVYSVITYR